MKQPEIQTKPVSSSWREMLRVVPVRNQAAEFERMENGMLRVSVQKKRPRWLVFPLTLIIRLRPKTKIQLENLGTKIFDYCDGKNTIENITDKFAAEYNLTFHESRIIVTKYAGELVRRGILAIAA